MVVKKKEVSEVEDIMKDTYFYNNTAYWSKKGGVYIKNNPRLKRAYAIFSRELQARTDSKQRLRYLLKNTYDAVEQLSIMRLAYKKELGYELFKENREREKLEREIIKMHKEEKLSIKEIANVKKMNYETVRKIVRKHDRKTRNYRKLTDYEVEFIKQYLLMNESVYAISKALNRNVSTVYYAIKRLNLKK